MNTKILRYDKKNIFLLYIRLLLIMGFILALIISFVLTYNEILSLKDKKKILSELSSQKFSLFQSMLILIIAILFLYINYVQFIIDKSMNNDVKDSLLQIQSSIFALLSAIIGFYVTIKNYHNKNYTVVKTQTI